MQMEGNVLQTISQVFSCSTDEIGEIEILKKGMTNRSFLFSVRGSRYVMRIPGEGTNLLINRKEEAEVYKTIKGLGFCDDPVYLNPANGYKITKYIGGVRSCRPQDEDDLIRCMEKLKDLHSRYLQVGHAFDLYGMIEFYEKLWDGLPSAYSDYKTVKSHVLELKHFTEKTRTRWCLTHIDAVADNFLFYRDESGQEKLQLTDWEYSGMQDPDVDLAMFAIYSNFDRTQAEHLMDLYYGGACTDLIRCKIYCYMAACGLLWSNWEEFKAKQGVRFGEYGRRQYQYAGDFYQYAKELMRRHSYV